MAMLNNQMVYIYMYMQYIYLEVEVNDVEAMAHRNGSMTNIQKCWDFPNLC